MASGTSSTLMTRLDPFGDQFDEVGRRPRTRPPVEAPRGTAGDAGRDGRSRTRRGQRRRGNRAEGSGGRLHSNACANCLRYRARTPASRSSFERRTGTGSFATPRPRRPRRRSSPAPDRAAPARLSSSCSRARRRDGGAADMGHTVGDRRLTVASYGDHQSKRLTVGQSSRGTEPRAGP